MCRKFPYLFYAKIYYQMMGKKNDVARFLPLISILFTSKDQAFPQAKEMEAIEVSKQGIICK